MMEKAEKQHSLLGFFSWDEWEKKFGFTEEHKLHVLALMFVLTGL